MLNSCTELIQVGTENSRFLFLSNLEDTSPLVLPVLPTFIGCEKEEAGVEIGDTNLKCTL